MLDNKVKEKLVHGKNTTGMIMGIHSPAFVEMIGHAGYDFLIIDDEHGAYSWRDMEEMIKTALLVDLVPIVRTDYNASSIQKVLDRGALGVQVPMVNTRKDAEQVVQRAKYPPRGKRGTAYSMRAAGYSFFGGKEYMDAADANTLVAVHIETPEAVDNFEDIVQVPGVDIAFIGPADLSVNMGYKEEGPAHPEVQQVIRGLYEKGRKLGVKIGTIAGSREGVQQAHHDGASFVSVVMTVVMKKALNDVLESQD
ncbi:HpcH/HpaI aldolase family protein [Salibacterium sp. K-3]